MGLIRLILDKYFRSTNKGNTLIFILSFQGFVLRTIYMLYILAIKNKRSPLQVIMNHYYNKLYWDYFLLSLLLKMSLLKHSFNTLLPTSNTPTHTHAYLHLNVFRETWKDSAKYLNFNPIFLKYLSQIASSLTVLCLRALPSHLKYPHN